MATTEFKPNATVNSNNNEQVKATKEFLAADKLARAANDASHHAKVALKDWKEEKYRLDNWKSIMSTAPVVLFSIIFVLVSIGEYYISKEIYREFSRKMPWLIAIVFFVAGVFVSEFLVYKIFKQKRDWKRFEIDRDPNNNNLTDDEKSNMIKKITNNFFIFGLILGILLVTAIGFLSYKRVQGELAANMRTSGFGIMDTMPMLLYVVEIITGAFVLYLLKEIGQIIKVKGLWKKFNKMTLLTHKLSTDAIKKYLDAEKLDYDPFNVPLTDNIHTTFYRNINKSVDNKEDYIQEPEEMEDVFNLLLIDENGNPLQRQINIITNYKFSLSGSTNNEGRLALRFEKTFPGDSVKNIFIRKTAEDKDYISINGNYDLDRDTVHKVIIK